MAGFQVIRQNFKSAGTLMLSVIDDMIANGFVAKFPLNELTSAYQKPTGDAVEAFNVTLEAGPNVDPLNATEVVNKQPWRVNIRVYDNATAGMIVGAADALKDDGTIPLFLDTVVSQRSTTVAFKETTEILGSFGVVGANYTPLYKGQTSINDATDPFFLDEAAVRPHYLKPNEGIINRARRVWTSLTIKDTTGGGSTSVIPAEKLPVLASPEDDLSASYPMSYYLAITPRGFFLSIWEGVASDTDGKYFSWVLVQRPVDRDTGQTITTGKAPVFCVNSVGNTVNRFVVREADIVRATEIYSATEDTVDCTAIINDKVQVAVSEDNQYVVSFPSRLNTPRFAYTYELDMIGYTSASVVAHNAEIPLTLYNEAQPRNYIAMHANQPNGNGMRIVALKKGGGINA